jgi:hypothetical protein
MSGYYDNISRQNAYRVQVPSTSFLYQGNAQNNATGNNYGLRPNPRPSTRYPSSNYDTRRGGIKKSFRRKSKKTMRRRRRTRRRS